MPVSNVRRSLRPYVRAYFCQSTENVFDFDEISRVGRGRRLMHDSMHYDPIQGQGHEPFKVGKSDRFQKLSPPPFTMGAVN